MRGLFGALISISLVYQRHEETWDEVSGWYEQAYSAVLLMWDENDGITLALAKARENRHFAYVTDEGRPFKSIFGITSVTIRPGRLHID